MVSFSRTVLSAPWLPSSCCDGLAGSPVPVAPTERAFLAIDGDTTVVTWWSCSPSLPADKTGVKSIVCHANQSTSLAYRS